MMATADERRACLVADVEHLMGWASFRNGAVLAARLGLAEPTTLYKRLKRAGRADLAEVLAANARQAHDDATSERMHARRSARRTWL